MILNFLTVLKNRTIFLFVPVWLNLSCQTFRVQSDEKESNTQKIVETNLNFAQKQIDSGQPEHALQTLRPLLNQFPENSPLLNMVGISYLALSNPAHAKLFFKKAYDFDKNPMYALNLSSSLIAEGSFQAAENILKKMIEEKSYPLIERVYHNYALTFEKRKNYKKAIEYYTKALDENPSYYLSNIRLGKVFQLMNARDSAKLAFEKALATCAVCFEPVSEVCIMYFDEGNYAKASSLLQHFLSNKEISTENRSQAKSLLNLASKMSASN